MQNPRINVHIHFSNNSFWTYVQKLDSVVPVGYTCKKSKGIKLQVSVQLQAG